MFKQFKAPLVVIMVSLRKNVDRAVWYIQYDIS